MDQPSPSPQEVVGLRETPDTAAKGPRNKTRARLVCANCRQRKIKCDAERITPGTKCTPCRSSNTPCTIDRNADRRRHGASQHKKLSEMQERIRSLEGMIQKVSNEGTMLSAVHVPMMVDNAAGELQQVAMVQSATAENSTRAHGSQETFEDEQGQGIDERQDGNAMTEKLFNHQGLVAHPRATALELAQIDPELTANRQTESRGSVSEYNMGHNRDESGSTSVDRLANTRVLTHGPISYAVPDLPTVPPMADITPLPHEVSTMATHTGSIHDVQMSGIEEGRPRILRDKDTNDIAFYGSTTQFHIHSPETNAGLLRPDTDFQNGSTLNMDSTQLHKALYRIFFNIQPNSQIIVSEGLFTRDCSKGGRQKYYSPFLRDAILAAATRHSTSSAVRKLGRLYAERAKVLIPSEIERPNIASLQSFLLMSDFEATRGRARLGWTYNLIATGLLIDLALHVEYSDAINKDAIPPGEAELRDTLLLGTFVYATLWSLYLGRPNSISSPVIAAVRRVIGDGTCSSPLYMWVALCMQMQDIIEILNSPTGLRKDQWNASFRLCAHEINLRAVFDGVPAELAFDDARIDELDAEAYAPHMQYFGLQVTLHRAIIRAGQSDSRGRNEAQPKSLDHLYTVVHDNAVRIAKMILSYRRIFGLENIITVMLDNVYVAAVALTSHIARMQQRSLSFEDEVRWLRSLYEVLEAVEKHYPVTIRMKSSLIHFIEQTPLGSIFPGKVPVTSPRSVPESTTGLLTNDPVPVNLSSQTAKSPPVPIEGSDFANLEFTLTTEDDWWLHDSAWNMTSLPFET